MIRDQKQIIIEALPQVVFELIETMPNKFPVYHILETKPLFFLRVLLVDGFRAALDSMNYEKPDGSLLLNIGDYMGPFQLTESEKPFRYMFTLKSFFFNCQTGYSLRRLGTQTAVYFDLVAEDPSFTEKIWWFIVKPFHGLLATKVLRVIKKKAELS